MKDTKRASRRNHEQRRKDHLARVVNVRGYYSDEEAREAVIKRLYTETSGRKRLERGILQPKPEDR